MTLTLPFLLAQTKNVLLIRDPVYMLSSWANKLGTVPSSDMACPGLETNKLPNSTPW